MYRLRRLLRLRNLLRFTIGVSTTLMMALVFVVLFEPGLTYHTSAPVPSTRSPALLDVLGSAVEQAPLALADVTLYPEGKNFYPAELALIRSATSSIDVEAFIFHATPIGQRFIDALAERARAGVKVRVVVDAVGSLPTPDHFFDTLRAAGAQVAWYQPFRWYTLKRWNNRTHRELLIVDGQTAFIGGAGIGAAWDSGTVDSPPWRDLMARVTGAPARGLQAVFAQSWLESHGEILVGPYITSGRTTLPAVIGIDEPVAIVVGSTPTGGRSTRARVLFQVLVGAARQELLITSPYFVPDRSMRNALLDAVARGVRVTIMTNGEHNNHTIARLASRRSYGELIAGGVQIHEYQPGMLHAKIMLVDGLWSVLGSTNFDNRSFGLNNEVNLALRDATIATGLHSTVASYLDRSRRITLTEWADRSLGERALAALGSVLERQE
ncbi:phospholipase D-like domain-containing protein [Actimicrobium sp. CCC2.4]|uniref:phospholipase D-like domain-containing protein n=1 Tax=Actimicrobium sp. CCC2.4 TaxID=3048606 RepID=UPI002AC93B32|nr:phospholipase D-like domain-containing protein [Actimicrobium sp. CCC2.4]MEB0133865.1 phospholipase D-like domain-containing protein [Actimicrobium sp. CCC2.4]WPX31406.1 phospholipase D-like domain-containing protein [Actimicrobium sp. CCC2.4]